MSALNGTASFRRYFTSELLKTHTNEKLLQSINARRCLPVPATEQLAFGWVPMGDALAEAANSEDVFVGNLICLGFRMDEKVVKASDVRDEMKLQARQLVIEKGRPLSKGERTALKEAVVAELRAHAPVRRKVSECVWNPARKELRIFGASKKMAAICIELFMKTFAAEAEDVTALGIMKSLFPSSMADGKIPEPEKEFLTYLWYLSEHGSEHVSAGNWLRLNAMDGSGVDVVVKGETSSASVELFSSLNRGSQVVAAKIVTSWMDGDIVTGKINTDTFSINGCTLPKAPDREIQPQESDAPKSSPSVVDEAKLLYRMGMLDNAQDKIDQLLLDYLKLRSSDGYDNWRGGLITYVKENNSVRENR